MAEFFDVVHQKAYQRHGAATAEGIAKVNATIAEARADAESKVRALRKALRDVVNGFAAFNDDESGYDKLGQAVVKARQALADNVSEVQPDDCDHDWIAGLTFDTYPGYQQFTCSRCGAIKTEPL